MNEIIIEEILKECKWYEKIIIKIFKKLFIKMYKIGVKKGFKLAN